MNTIQDRYGIRCEMWAIHPKERIPAQSLMQRGSPPPDPRVHLDTADARVGRRAQWGGGAHTAEVRAVVYVDGQPETLLLEDFTGYPWIRVGLDAPLVPEEKTTENGT